MKTFLEFQLECLEKIDRNSLNEGLLDDIARFIPKSKDRGGYTGTAQRIGKQVFDKVGNYTNQAQRLGQKVTKGVSSKLQNVGGQVERVKKQVTDRVGTEIDKVRDSIAPPPKRTNRNDGSSRDSSGMGTIDKIGGSLAAAREAVPAIAAGALGINRTDRNISPEMEREIKAAHSRALARHSKDIDYKDYSDTPAGFAAQKTMGRIGDRDWKRDNKGNITGLRQTYDTDKTPRQLAGEIVNSARTGNISQLIYKPAELALSLSQRRGITKHDVDFNKGPSDKQNDSASLSRKVYSPSTINAYSTATAPIRKLRDSIPSGKPSMPGLPPSAAISGTGPSGNTVGSKPTVTSSPTPTVPAAAPTTTPSSNDKMNIWATANPKLAAKLKNQSRIA